MYIVWFLKKFLTRYITILFVFYCCLFQGAESLLPLLKLAKERIPEQYWSSTPLVLKATAGLRLLPDEKAEALLLEVRFALPKS